MVRGVVVQKLDLPYIKSHYKDSSIKRSCYWHMNRWTDQRKMREIPVRI